VLALTRAAEVLVGTFGPAWVAGE